MNITEYSFADCRGDEIHLADYAGRPVLLTNIATHCTYADQLGELEELWQHWREQGLVVIAVPSNDFGEEPNDDQACEESCRRSFGVTFPITAKVHVVGGQAHPVFKALMREGGEIAIPRWNFHKYLIGPGGETMGIWPSATSPKDPALLGAVTEAVTGRRDQQTG